MANKRVRILCDNIFLNGEKHLKEDVVEIPAEEYDVVVTMDKEAGRETRIKVTKDSVGKAADPVEEDGEE